MHLEHANEKFDEYILDGSQLIKNDREKILKDLKNNIKNEFFVNNDISEMQLYRLQLPENEEYSYILLCNDVLQGNILKVPDLVFQILEECKGISFEYQPYIDIFEEVKRNFKFYIDKTLSIIELIYHVMIRFHNSPNFYFYLVIVSEMLDKHCKILNSFNNIMKVKERLGKNLNYIVISMKNVGFGMIDPEGCLLLENNQFNYKNLSFKPVISSKASLKFNKEIEDAPNKIDKNLTKHKKNSVKQFINSDVLSNWLFKIINNKGHLFVLNAEYFKGKNGLNKSLKQKGYKITKLNNIKEVTSFVKPN